MLDPQTGDPLDCLYLPAGQPHFIKVDIPRSPEFMKVIWSLVLIDKATVIGLGETDLS